MMPVQQLPDAGVTEGIPRTHARTSSLLLLPKHSDLHTHPEHSSMSHPEQKSALNIVMGCMTFGAEGAEGCRIHDPEEVGAILDVFQAHGHHELDTARLYCFGTSEEMLATVEWKKRGLAMGTKLWPTALWKMPNIAQITHSPEDLRKYFEESLKALKTDCIDLWYLHGPDRSVPYEVTLKAVDELHREGKFKRFGLSNYMSWEVAEIVGICRASGYIQPTVYQGIYNAVHRAVEPELFPCLRKFGIAFYEYNALAGGLFTGRYHSIHDAVPPGSRFDPDRLIGKGFRSHYWKEPYFAALAVLEPVVQKHGLTLAEVALRWMSHHSLLRREHGDAIIIGASSLKHVEQNLIDLEKGPLPEEVVKALDEAWSSVKGVASNYFL
ncbi:aldo/keto reductase [Phanerochaete sordida]|uniref:Aldo/keto reductase n=1 Tax=Phanerochaete sordida TaxID=48140 RepID=A0A9P3GJR3_9APHY|nr:aldo/keto reductase [Phanerochaete sordida]